MGIGQIHRCQNSSCRSEIQVVRPPASNQGNFRCSCGSEMKRPYAAPSLRRLSEDDPRGVEFRALRKNQCQFSRSKSEDNS